MNGTLRIRRLFDRVSRPLLDERSLMDLTTDYLLWGNWKMARVTAQALLDVFPTSAGDSIVEPLHHLGRRWAFCVARLSLSLKSDHFDNHKLIQRFSSQANRIEIALRKEEAFGHTVFVATYRDRLTAFCRSTYALREFMREELQCGQLRACVGESLVITADYESKLLARLLQHLLENTSEAERARLRVRTTRTISEGMDNPWDPELTEEQWKEGIDGLHFEIEQSEPEELFSVLARLRGGRVIVTDSESPAGFLGPLTRNEHFSQSAEALPQWINHAAN